MADLTARRDSLLDYLPGDWQQAINTSPVVNALSRMVNRPTPNLERGIEYDQHGNVADRNWLLEQARGGPPKMHPLAAEMLEKGGLLANFLGPGVKLPGVPRAPGRYAMEYPGGRIDYKDMDGGVHVSGIYTNPEARGQGNAKQALQELIAAADAAKRPMSLEISPGAPGVDPARLRQWYESLGFSGPDYAMTRQPPPTGIRAYHGSPHDFDRFDMSKIGTGEGMQAYGRGLYFAEKEAVAKEYRDELSRFTPFVDGRAVHPNSKVAKYLRRFNGDIDGGVRILERQIPEIEREMRSANGALNNILGRNVVADRPEFAGLAEAKEALAILKDLQARGSTLTLGKGRMYEVNIRADPEQFLDWDKPLSQQSDNVKAALQGIYPDGLPGGDVYQMMLHDARTSAIAKGNNPGTSLPAVMQRATDDLRSMGIPGIKYLDQQSRVAGQGSRNYVVFDDKLIEILRKYGLLPPVAAGTAAALNEQEPQQ